MLLLLIFLLLVLLVGCRNQDVMIDKTDNKSIGIFEASESGNLAYIKNIIE